MPDGLEVLRLCLSGVKLVPALMTLVKRGCVSAMSLQEDVGYIETTVVEHVRNSPAASGLVIGYSSCRR